MGTRGDTAPTMRGPWKVVAAVTLLATVTLVVAAVVALAVPSLRCHRGGRDNSTAELREALDVTNRSLAVSRQRWQRCREELGALRGQSLELELALANVTRLEEQNRALGTEVTRQREQLGEEKRLRSQLQQQIRSLQEQLRDVRSQRSPGDRPAVSPAVPILLFLLLGTLLL